MTEAALYGAGNLPLLKDRLHRRTMIGVNISEQDLMSDVGKASMGEDLLGSDDSNLEISSGFVG